MPITVKFDELRDPTYRRALTKLGNCSNYGSTKIAYDVGRVVKSILKDEFSNMIELEEKLVKQFAELDEKGNLKLSDDDKGNKQYKIIEGKEEEFAEKRKEFYSTEITVERNRIPIINLANVELTPMELVALENVIRAEDAHLQVVENEGKVEG